MPDNGQPPPRTGCLILFVPTLIVIDIVGGPLMGIAGRYAVVVQVVSLVGCVCGAIIGGFLFKNKPSTGYSLDFYVVGCGLGGMLIFASISSLIAANYLR
jgi:hypothetical protein